MLLLKTLLVILHIITAAAWFGLALPITRRARTVAAGGPGAEALAEEGARIVKLLGVFSVLTLVFAFGAFSMGISAGGSGTYGWPYHTALLLIVVLIGVHFVIVRPAWSALPSEAAVKRVAMGVGIGHTLWLVILVLMFWVQIEVALAML